MNLDAQGNPIYLQASKAKAVTPDDDAIIADAGVNIYIAVAGHVAVVMAGDTESVIFSNLAVGVIHPIRVTKVLSTGTTATGIVALW